MTCGAIVVEILSMTATPVPAHTCAAAPVPAGGGDNVATAVLQPLSLCTYAHPPCMCAAPFPLFACLYPPLPVWPSFVLTCAHSCSSMFICAHLFLGHAQWCSFMCLFMPVPTAQSCSFSLCLCSFGFHLCSIVLICACLCFDGSVCEFPSLSCIKYIVSTCIIFKKLTFVSWIINQDKIYWLV